MNTYDSYQVFTIVMAITAIFMAITAFLMINSYRKISRYSIYKQRAIVSEMRETYERKLNELAMQMTATPARWAELNHLLLSVQNEKSNLIRHQSAHSEFMSSLGISKEDIQFEPKLVFVLTPFSKGEIEIFDTIKGVCSDIGLRCIRGDENQINGEILPHIVKLIAEAGIIIANISSRNANVLYELGIAHAMSKTTIIVSRNIYSVPFDMRGRRIVIFSNLDELKDGLLGAFLKIGVNNISSNLK